MPGNELKISEYLLGNIDKITLPLIGRLIEIGAPNQGRCGYTPINNLEDIKLLSSEDSHKKADIYINGKGMSIKQSGSSFQFDLPPKN